MIPAQINLAVQQGDTFNYTFTWTAGPNPVDLTGCVANMQIKQNYGDPALLSLSSAAQTANGSGLTLGGTAGTIEVNISATDAQNLLSGLYDIEVLMADGVTVNTPVGGSVTVNPGVTVWP